MKYIKLLIIPLAVIMLCGCELLDETRDRDYAIQECKDKGGTPYVENYNDSNFRPIVHCQF